MISNRPFNAISSLFMTQSLKDSKATSIKFIFRNLIVCFKREGKVVRLLLIKYQKELQIFTFQIFMQIYLLKILNFQINKSIKNQPI